MKKRFISILLILCIAMTLLSMTAIAQTAEKPYNEDDVTWIGTTDEYKKTLSAFFDENGLRLMPVGDLTDDGDLINVKYGLVRRDGTWAAQPVYEKIEADYLVPYRSNFDAFMKDFVNTTDPDPKPAERIFLDGYVQATRGGKMGLLDITGREVIPCKYEAVGLPVDGVSRVIVKSGDKYLLGYWGLAAGKEIIAPKYAVSGASKTAHGSPASSWVEPDKSVKRLKAQFDFENGYALVTTGKVETVTHTNSQFKEDSIRSKLVYAQIIDKNGKEVLPDGPYAYGGHHFGPYMVYKQVANKKLSVTGGASFSSYDVYGVVGPKGIVIPAQYHAGIRGSNVTGWYLADPRMIVIPEFSLVITDRCADGVIPESASRRGAVNFNNKEVVPFKGEYTSDNIDVFETVSYDTALKLVWSVAGWYRPDGTKVSAGNWLSKYRNGYIVTGKHGDHDASNTISEISVSGVINPNTGTTYTHSNLQGSGFSPVSAVGSLWIKKQNLWGLVNLKGEVLLPFEYEDTSAGVTMRVLSDEITHYFDSNWARPSGGYALVKKNGKWGAVDSKGAELLPCIYNDIINDYKDKSKTLDCYLNIQDSSGKWGVYNLNTRKITTPCKLAEPVTMNRYLVGNGLIAGTAPIGVGDSLYALLDVDTGKILTPTYFGISSAGIVYGHPRGLFRAVPSDDYYGPDGRIVFPRTELLTETRSGYKVNGKYEQINKGVGEDLTLVVRDGKVGYVNASRLAGDGKALPTKPRSIPKPLPLKPGIFLVTHPDKDVYAIGDGFDTKGIVVHYQDEKGIRSVLDNSKVKFTTSGIELTEGRKWTSLGTKVVEAEYNGMKSIYTFGVKVIEALEGQVLEEGDYYLQILGKYLYPVKASGFYWIELSDKKPDKPFNVKLINESTRQYSIAYDGEYIYAPASAQGEQLISTKSSVPHYWRIMKYTNFCTIRDFKNQGQIVNASGQKKANGTKVIIWNQKGSTPDHAKVSFIKP